MKKIKVSLYIRHHKTQTYEKAENTIYPHGTIFVLRYLGKWQTLKNCTSYQEGFVAAMQKEIELLTGKAEPYRCKPKPKVPQALDVLIDVYLTTGKAAEQNWRKHTLQAYALGLRLFRQSCKKSQLDEITGDDLKAFKIFLRKYCTKTGKPYDPRSIWNHFNNLISFLNEHGKGNLVQASDWPKYEAKKVVCYDERDIALLLHFADEDESDVIEFFLGAGFRNGEVAHVEWLDFDYVNREIKIYSKEEQFGWQVKDSEERIIGISDRLADKLHARHLRNPGNGLIFPNTKGNPDKHLLRVIKKLALRSGLNCGRCLGVHERKRVTCSTHPVCSKWILHTLRKTWATFQARSGADVRTIQADAGHSSLETTLNYLAAESRRSAARRAQINGADARVRQHMGLTI